MIQVKKEPVHPLLPGIPLLDKREESATIVPRVRPARLMRPRQTLKHPFPPEE
jgi:hypothetical protein